MTGTATPAPPSGPVARVLAAVAGWPPASHRRMAAMLGALSRPLMARRWRVAARNLEACFPDDDAAAMAARLAAHRRSLWHAVFELLRAWFAPAPVLAGEAEVEVEGLDDLREAHAAGEGVLLLTGHLMHTELATRFLAEALGAPVGGVVRRYDRHPRLERLLDGARRARLGPTVGKFDTRGMVRHLRAGGRLVYSADQDFRQGQVFVPFFGVPAATFAGIPQLLRAGRARLRFLSMVRSPEGRYRVRVRATGLEVHVDDPKAFARGYMALLEAAVREAPDQYLWVHRRFKTRPPGEGPFYR